MVETQKGSLVVVGSGIQLINHMTHEARLCIENSEKVFHVVNDYPTAKWLETLNANAESLTYLYENGKPRQETYRQMVDVIMNHVRRGFKVCAVFYGHPGVFVVPGHEAIKLAKSEGYEARMLPGISSEDCLFADLGVDPGSCGCQSFEATDFLMHKRKFDPSSALVLWQIGGIGALDFQENGYSDFGIKILIEFLEEHYDPDYEVVVYEAALLPYPVGRPSNQRVKLADLAKARITPISTLCVPPKQSEPDSDMKRRLKLD